MNSSVFGKTTENVRKHRDIKLVTTNKRRNQLVSEPNYHKTKWFSADLLVIAILDLNKIVMYEFWYDYSKPKYGKKAKLCYMDTDSFIIHIKTKDFYKDIADDVEKRFDTSNYELDRPLPKEKNKKVIGLMKYELRGKSVIEFVALRPKTYSYSMDDNSEAKNQKEQKTMQ